MKRIKVLKAYLIIWLFILYVVYTNAELLGIFFMATVIFSTAILGLLAVGTLYQIVSGFHIMMLGGTFGALAYKKTGYEFYIRSIDSLLPANIAHMLQSRKSKQTMFFTQEESRNIIDWLEGKFRQQKSYINFFINTAMLIGLLGTFVGLVEAIDHMGQIILGLNGDIDIKQIMQDFSGPLSGMAIGFGASLFGVVCAVILGINGYILFRSQDTLISGIEDWLKDRIIDVAPEAFNGSAVSSTNLPEHRKSFMEVFFRADEYVYARNFKIFKIQRKASRHIRNAYVHETHDRIATRNARHDRLFASYASKRGQSYRGSMGATG
ncbi:MAG: MotA/TolQ/ExbB proton channel family protein [Sulfurospirillum cavolei]|nr:MotA/TolQ/ExbB proton channel family protein [Sulfurospirillum cavolei]